MSTVGIVPEEEAQRKPSESRVEQMLVSFWSFLSYLVVFIPVSKNNHSTLVITFVLTPVRK